MSPADARARYGRRRWIAQLGFAGFWFFLAKGLLWLAAPAVLYWFN